MNNKFYNHLIKIEPLHNKLSEYDIDINQRDEILSLLHSHIHITVIDVVLSELQEEEKKEFLHLVAIKEDHDGAWNFIITKIPEGEEKVKKAIDDIIDSFLNDLDSEEIQEDLTV